MIWFGYGRMEETMRWILIATLSLLLAGCLTVEGNGNRSGSAYVGSVGVGF